MDVLGDGVGVDGGDERVQLCSGCDGVIRGDIEEWQELRAVRRSLEGWRSEEEGRRGGG